MPLKLNFSKIWLSLFSSFFLFFCSFTLYKFKSCNFVIPYAEIAQNSLIFSAKKKKKSKLILIAYKYANLSHIKDWRQNNIYPLITGLVSSLLYSLVTGTNGTHSMPDFARFCNPQAIAVWHLPYLLCL